MKFNEFVIQNLIECKLLVLSAGTSQYSNVFIRLTSIVRALVIVRGSNILYGTRADRFCTDLD